MNKTTNITRNITDVKLTANVKLPATGKTVESGVIDIAQKGGIDSAMIHLSLPDLATLAATKKITAKLQSSSDGVTFADIPSVATLTVTGAESGGGEGKELILRIPYDAERYLRAVVTADASSGDVTAASLSFSVRV